MLTARFHATNGPLAATIQRVPAHDSLPEYCRLRFDDSLTIYLGRQQLAELSIAVSDALAAWPAPESSPEADGRHGRRNGGDSVTATREQIEAVESRASVDDSVVRAALQRVPPSWRMIQSSPGGGAFLRGTLQVLFSVCRYDDGRVWVHASVCGRTGEHSWYLPSFEEIKRVKHDFIGEDKWAYQVFPSSKDYVNHHAYVLHLYALMDGAPALPDFTWGLGTGTI